MAETEPCGDACTVPPALPHAPAAVAPKRPARPKELIYAVDEYPPLRRLLLLGFQFAVLNAIYLVIVIIVVRQAHVAPETARNVVSLALVAAAIATTLQALPIGPIGSGFLAPPVYSAIYLAPALLAADRGGLPLVGGMTMFAALTELGLGLLIRHLRIILQPVVSGLVVLVVGLQLGIVGMGQVLGGSARHPDMLGAHLTVAMLTLATTLAASIWGKGLIRLMSTFLGLTVGVSAAFGLGLAGAEVIDAVAAAPGVRVPSLSGLSYGFDPWLMPAFFAAGLAAALRTVGVVTTCQRINDANWSRPDMGNIRKGILADSLGCLTGGLLGAPGMNIGPSLVGISSVSGATSRIIAPVAGAFLIGFALIPPLATAALELPSSVAGGLLTFTGTVMVTSGMQIILSRPLDTRGRYIVGLSVLLALSRRIFAGDFGRLPFLLRTLTTNELSVGLISAMTLTLIFRIGARQRATLPGGCFPNHYERVGVFIRETAGGWKVTPDTIAACAEAVRSVLAYLRVACRDNQHVHLDLWYDGLDLGVDLRYDGPMIMHRLATARTLGLPELGFTNEEAAVEAGLHSYLQTYDIDRMRVIAGRRSIAVRLRFAV